MGKKKTKKAADEKKPSFEEIVKGEENTDAELLETPLQEQIQEEEGEPLFHMGVDEVPENLPDESWSIEDLSRTVKTDSHPLMRSNAVAALGRIGSIETIETLIHALKDDNGIVKANAMSALASFGDQVLDRMISALESDPDEDVRAGAAYVLGELGDLRSIPVLERAQDDESVFVRVHARASLIAIKPQGSEEDN
jgi:hypothetical protein